MGQGRTRTKQKRQKKEQFVRPTMMTLVVPFFFPPRHFGLCISLQFGAREVKEKRDERRDAQRRSTPKSANRFERNPHFCVGARAREIAREVAWTRKRLERDTSRLRERGTPVDLERHFESRIGEKARGKEGHSKVRAIVFCNARPRARARKKSARRIATSSRSISRGATDENALFVRARKRDIFFSLRCGWQRVR